MLTGWKSIANHVSRVAGYDVTVDSIRKAKERDADLARIVCESVTGKPLVSEYELERWVSMRRLPRTPRPRRIMRAIVESGQMVLL